MYETSWPDLGEMEMNDHKLLEFKPLQNNSSLKKRKDEKYYLRDPKLINLGPNFIVCKEESFEKEQKAQYRI